MSITGPGAAPRPPGGRIPPAGRFEPWAWRRASRLRESSACAPRCVRTAVVAPIAAITLRFGDLRSCRAASPRRRRHAPGRAP